MAKEDENEDLDLGEEKPSKKKLLIIIALVVLLLIGGGVAAFFILSGDEDSSAQTGQEDAQDQSEAQAEQGPAQYVEMEPVFVINLPGKPSLLQVGVSLRVYGDEMVEFVKHNDPMMRHHLINLLQSQEAAKLKERSAKDALQAEMLNEVNRILTELSAPGQVNALYFTSFVMQ